MHLVLKGALQNVQVYCTFQFIFLTVVVLCLTAVSPTCRRGVARRTQASLARVRSTTSAARAAAPAAVRAVVLVSRPGSRRCVRRGARTAVIRTASRTAHRRHAGTCSPYVRYLYYATRLTQPCIPSGSLNRVPALAGVKAGMSPLTGGR